MCDRIVNQTRLILQAPLPFSVRRDQMLIFSIADSVPRQDLCPDKGYIITQRKVLAGVPLCSPMRGALQLWIIRTSQGFRLVCTMTAIPSFFLRLGRRLGSKNSAGFTR